MTVSVVVIVAAADTHRRWGVHLRSSVPSKVLLCDFVGDKLDDARSEITGKGLKLGSVNEENSNEFFRPDYSSEPIRQFSVMPGATVDLVIGSVLQRQPPELTDVRRTGT